MKNILLSNQKSITLIENNHARSRRARQTDFLGSVNLLQQQGFTLYFALAGERLLCLQNGQLISRNEATITERFNYHDVSKLLPDIHPYAVESLDFGLKGILLK